MGCAASLPAAAGTPGAGRTFDGVAPPRGGPVTPGPAPRRRVGILRWLLAAVILLPLVEIVVLVAVGRSIGVLWTIGLLLGMAVLGTWLSRREGGRTVRALQEAVQTGRMPAREATD